MPEALRLETPYLTLAAKAWGPVDGRPVLALHGWLDNAATFDRLAPLLPGLRIVAWDAPGHGHSDHRQSGGYHFVDYIADAVHALDALGWERASLLGHSMGAGISAMCAGAIPERIESLALIEGLAPLTQEGRHAPRRLAKSIIEEAKRAKRSDKRVYTAFDAALERRADLGKMSLDAARLLLERATEQVEGGFTWRSDPRLRLSSRQYFGETAVEAYLSRIACPTIMVRATEGWPVDLARMKARLELIEGLRYVELPGNHHLHLENPEPVAEQLRDFFGSL